MKIVALYDIHGNLPALDAVLQDVEQENPDLILVGGDIVPGPMPRAALERLLTLGDIVHYGLLGPPTKFTTRSRTGLFVLRG